MAIPLKPLLKRARSWWLRHAPGSRISFEGTGHQVTWADAQLHRCRIRVTGHANTLEIGSGAILWGINLEITGNHLVCRIGGRTRLRGGTYVLNDDGSQLQIGAQTTMTNPVIVAQGGRAVRIGADCMIAYGADLRCSDGHQVLDASTGSCLNPAADVVLGDHVWIGIHAQLLKGTVVGDHAIVAARSVVTRPVAPHSLVAGNPARLIRQGVTWDRRRFPPIPVNSSASPPPSPASPLHAAVSLHPGAELR